MRLLIVISICILIAIGNMANRKIRNNKANEIILNDSINTLNDIIHIKDSIWVDHISNCAMVSNDMIYLDYTGNWSIKSMRDLTFNI